MSLVQSSKENKNGKSIEGPPVQWNSRGGRKVEDDDQQEEEEETHPLFLEMEHLTRRPSTGCVEWKETARWIKFEEDVEEGGNRWSKPHVGSLSLHSLIELKWLLVQNLVILDMTADDLTDIANQVARNFVNSKKLDESWRAEIVQVLLGDHKHLYQEEGGGGGKNDSSRGNTHLMRKILPNAEACNVLVGDLDFLDHEKTTLSAFIRLTTAVILKGVTEVQIPTRFLFILLGPLENTNKNHQVGRAMSTLLSDAYFVRVAYKAKNRGDILEGVDEFLDSVTVIPPGQWDTSIRIEPPATTTFSTDPRKRTSGHSNDEGDDDHDEGEEEDEEKLREKAGLVRTGKFFGGLINDFKRKRPWYWSDFKDALALQCVASWIYLYFACLTPIITFGGLLGKATHQKMAAMESLVSGFICGVGYGLFSGQPITILGSTGPILVFEKVLDELCQRYEFDYMELRFWIGLWVGLILIFLVAFDASAFVSYITRFTEENFATLVSLIFVVEAFKNVAEIHHLDSCRLMPNDTTTSRMDPDYSYDAFEMPAQTTDDHFLVDDQCESQDREIFLMSVILFLGTFVMSLLLKNFRNSSFFPNNVRQFVSDFSVIIAIVSMSLIDLLSGLMTPKLVVPEKFQPTLPTRGWIISPFGQNPVWTVFAAILPALLATILISLDQQITAVIVNRKEHKLKKGCGYHLDLLVVAFLIIICSVIGVPWFVAATVQAITHVDSLKMESECAAPGEKPQFLGVREQRVTQIAISIMIGLSVLMTPVLKHIPMPVLYGVFLYMGYSGLQSMQLFDRILIMFMPKKYQPDHKYLRHIPLARIHFFTLIQLACLVILWLIKSFKSTSVLFPLMLVIMIIVRKLLDKAFSQKELKLLDHLMPKSTKKRDSPMRRITNDRK